MTSLININNIDITYPVAGQDNDTQGFRTNFQNIRNNFVTASKEISSLQDSLATTQTQVYGNANVAVYLPHYTGNISAGNLNVTNVTYTNQEIINTSDVITGNAAISGNLITTIITTPTGSQANLLIDPDGNADLIINAANIWMNAGHLRSTASTFYLANLYPSTAYILGNASAIYMGAPAGNVTVGSNLIVNNSITVNNGLYSTNNFTGSYSDGIVVDYVTSKGRISVGSGDNLTFYTGGPANTQTLTIASNAVVSLSSAIQFANLTTAQVNAISTPARGMTVYNYTTGNIQVYNGTRWANITLS